MKIMFLFKNCIQRETSSPCGWRKDASRQRRMPIHARRRLLQFHRAQRAANARTLHQHRTCAINTRAFQPLTLAPKAPSRYPPDTLPLRAGPYYLSQKVRSHDQGVSRDPKWLQDAPRSEKHRFEIDCRWIWASIFV